MRSFGGHLVLRVHNWVVRLQIHQCGHMIDAQTQHLHPGLAVTVVAGFLIVWRFFGNPLGTSPSSSPLSCQIIHNDAFIEDHKGTPTRQPLRRGVTCSNSTTMIEHVSSDCSFLSFYKLPVHKKVLNGNIPFLVGSEWMTRPSLNMVTRTHTTQVMMIMDVYLTFLHKALEHREPSTSNIYPYHRRISHSGKEAGLTTQKSARLQIWHGLNDLEIKPCCAWSANLRFFPYLGSLLVGSAASSWNFSAISSHTIAISSHDSKTAFCAKKLRVAQLAI